MTAKYDVDPGVTALIQRARDEAILVLQERRGGEVPPTRANLELLADLVRVAILHQAAGGQWSSWGVTGPEQLLGLRVSAEVNRGMVGPTILIREDFSRTTLPFLITESVVGS